MGIVNRLRLWGEHGLRSSLDDLKEAADRIEALETQNEGYNLALAEQLEVRQQLETELDRCRMAMAVMDNTVEGLRGYAVHDENCEDHGAYPGSCTCGLSKLIKEISGE